MRPQTTLLHGFTGGPESWSEVLNGAEAMRPTLAGHGPTPIFVPDFNHEVDRLARRMRCAGHRHNLVGYSFGARVALGIATRHPTLVARLTLIGVNPGLGAADARSARQAWEAAWADRILRDGVDAFVGEWSQLPLFASQRTLESARLAGQDVVRRRQTAEGLAHAIRVCGLGRMPSYRDAFAHLPMPISLVVGALDTKFLRIAQELVVRRPQTDLTVVEDVGHNVVLEAPDTVRALLSLRA